jgi:hypothetical protein
MSLVDAPGLPTQLDVVNPIVIGEYSDVPAPGSLVASAWSQKATRRTVHRFASVAARDAAYPAAQAGNGAICVTTDTGMLWIVKGGAWASQPPWLPPATNLGQYLLGNPLSATAPIDGTWTRFTSDLALPASSARWLVTYATVLASTSVLNCLIRVYGIGSPGYFDTGAFGVTNAYCTVSGVAVGGSVIAAHGQNSGPAPATTYGDSSKATLFAVGLA